MLLDHLFEHVPHLRAGALDHALGRLDVLRVLEVDEPLHHERLEQLERHLLGQTALLQLELRADDDDRTARVVDALAEQVLAEPALLALQHVGERLERAVAGARDRAPAAAVVEQRVDGLLQHALLVVDDDLGRAEVEEPLQPVVAVDHAAVQVVEVGGREAATVELHHRAQVRRDHRDRVEHHAHRRVDLAVVVVDAVERRDDLEPLDRLRLALALGGEDGVLEELLLGLHVDARDEVLDGLRAHAALEVLLVAVLQLAPDPLVVDELLGRETLEGVPHRLQELDLGVGAGADVLEVLVAGLLGPLQLVLLGVALLELLELGLVLLVALAELELALALDVADLGADVGLELLEVLVPALVVDPRDDVGGEVDDLLEALRRDVEQVAEAARDALEVPDVRDRARRARCGPCARGAPSSA